IFRNPLYNQILAEAVEHCSNDGFKAEPYFLNHPDIVVGQLASQLTMDEVPLPRSLEMKTSEKTMQQQVEHLLLDFRMSVVKQHIKDLQTQLRSAGSDMQLVMQLMQELK
ncbi:DNA primase, partial [Parabacteroides distasonis]